MNRYSPADIEIFVNRLYQGQPVFVVPYSYTVSFAGLTTTGTTNTQTKTLSITANADFVFMQAYYHAVLAAAGQTVSNRPIALARVLIVDTGTNEQFTNEAVDLEAFATNGSVDNTVVYPRLIQGRTALSLTATGYGPAAETYTALDLTLSGVLVRMKTQ